jgi:hypothetical protein
MKRNFEMAMPPPIAKIKSRSTRTQINVNLPFFGCLGLPEPTQRDE